MNDNLQVIETNNQRVLTTAQIAERYETSTDLIQRNFSRNKERYTEGRHYYCLVGDALREFKATGQIDVSPNLNKFYLWTEKGALLHAKSLNTDKAWEAYEVLVDTYFSVHGLPQRDSYMIEDPVLRAQRWIEEQKEKQQLLTTVAVQNQQIAELQPKASYYDVVLNCKDLHRQDCQGLRVERPEAERVSPPARRAVQAGQDVAAVSEVCGHGLHQYQDAHLPRRRRHRARRRPSHLLDTKGTAVYLRFAEIR